MHNKLLKILQKQFNLESFRDGQEEVVQSVVDWKDTLVFMPTGGWKSLTYQLPGIYREWVVLVISPLISLMKDQVDKLKELWIRTELINSTIDGFDIQIILNDLSNPNTDIKFLYIAPERLNSSEFLRVISKVNIALVAIDEAHCISQWWHDFRPSYMKIRWFLDKLRTPPILSRGYTTINSFPPREKEAAENSTFIENTKDYITQLSRELRKKWTKWEELLWGILKNKKINWVKFRRQHPFWRYIADFYSDELKLVIELDWEIHEKQKEYDIIRDEIISNYWVQILRVKNEELDNIKELIDKILSPLGGKYPKGDRGTFPIMALTATATKKVRVDIIERLWLVDYNSFTSWFDRKNITIIVREISKKDEKIAKVAEILEKTPWSWIIYCASRKAVKELYDVLLVNWVKVWMYTWAMSSDLREREQNAFMNDEYKVIVATNAFGMWIDKKDIRFVIHYNLPGSIENYYQEVWRAWRDWKKSFWVAIASFWDTKIQEFFIENTYPSKEEILKLYDFLYKWEKDWGWKWRVILKTYSTIASESWINSDMKVWSALKILEKYWILRKWVDSNVDNSDFRWRWLTLVQEKRKHSNLLVDWNRQELLKDEAYFKLEQVKKLLFYPTCRKRFILNYFWDEEDLATLPDNCWACDYCIEKKNMANTEIEDYVNISVFALVLDVVKKNDAKIGVVMMTKFLRWSRDAKIIEWNMHKKDDFWVLEDLTSELIQAVIEALIW
jgi:superfamily II DNA helicase RecQ/very-short-patch-repair endonuclease